MDNELELINETLDVVLSLDPDLITGWEVQNASWGYLASRASHTFSQSSATATSIFSLTGPN